MMSAATSQDIDKVALTISGNIEAAAPAEFSIRALEALPRTTIVTATPWHDGKVTFEGVLLSDLMAQVGGKGTRAEFFALNDYRAVIPVADFKASKPILAYKVNGDYISIRKKGPLFVIYPYDQYPEMKTEIFYSRSVWQVRSIVIE
ncbi:molybdopterin-dependent oxidoreductase [Labrenzia sp. 011]|uniref:molybdopterin-dependent oxidoreductase n=1 Tax=Labrenzia sp. 011 TaxID=2171494 RepID=UPI00197B123C|nr:molybdopterin-dependent oxidoreductase [Labrenzia sp. 011]